MNKFEARPADAGGVEQLLARIAHLEAECQRLQTAGPHDGGDSPPKLHCNDVADGSCCRPAGLAGVYEWDEAEDRCVFCSPELARLHAMSVDAFVRRHGDRDGYLQRLEKDDRTRYTDALETMRATGRRLEIEYRLTRANGTPVELRESREPVFDKNGRLVRTLGFLQDVTDINRLTGELRLSEGRFSHFADESVHFLWEMGPDLRFTYVSEGIRRVTGEDPADFIGKTRRDIAGPLPVAPDALKANLAQMERRESFDDFLIQRPRTTGGTVHLRISGRPIFAEDGTFLGYRGTAHDVSERRGMLDALRRNRKKYRDLVEGSIQGMMVSRDWKPLFANQACADIFGFPSIEAFLDLESIEPLIVPEERQRLRSNRDARMRGEGVPGRQIAHCVRADGTVIWLEGVNRLVDWEGEPAILTTIIDITEHKQAEEALRKSEARLRAILDHAPFEMVLKDADGRYLEINRHCEQHWGVENDAVRGRLPHEVFPGNKLAEESHKNDLAVLASGSLIEREVQVVTDEGPRSLFTTKFPVRDTAGVIAGLGAITVDVTKLKIAEERLRQARDELETKVLERTAELRDTNRALKEEIRERKQAERELQESQARLSDAIESISDGFVLFDTDEKLVMCNSRYRELYAGIADRLVIGAGLEDLVRTVAERGLLADAGECSEDWIQRRLKEYRAEHESRAERQLADGRWIHGTIRRTMQGGIVGTRADITERKNAELAVQQSEDRLRQTAELAGLGYCIWDSVEDRCVSCSEEYARIHGTTVEGYLASAAPAGGNCPFTHPEDAESYRLAIENLRRDGAGFGLEYRMVLPSGEIRHVRVNVKPVFDDQGQVVQEYLTMQDISEQKETEIALRNNQELLTSIIDHAPAVIDVKDEQSRFVLANRQLETQFRVRREEIMGKKCREFLPKDLADECEAGDRYVLETGRDAKGERTLRFEDGERTFYGVKFKIPQLAGGTGAAVGRILTDITELKRRELALREHQELLETIMDTAPVSLTVKDAESRYIYVNRHELEIFGLRGVDYIGKQPEELVNAEMARHVRKLDRKVVETGRPIPQFEEQFSDAENRMRHWLSAKVPVTVDGAVRYIVTMGLDITEAKARDDELKQAQKMEAIGRLTSGIAHDFNNLLAVINANLLFLKRKGGLNAEALRNLDAIETAAGLGSGLTQGLLSFSRQESFDSGPVDLPELIEGAKKSLFQTLPDTIEIRTDFAADTQAALTDPQQFQNALFNLVLNAKDAMPGGGTVTIATRNVDGLESDAPYSNGSWVEVTVTDTGIGILESKLKRVFDPLFSTKPPGSGTGLGLSMVQRFVEYSRGRIDISSTPGCGTTLTLLLPRAVSAQGQDVEPIERTDVAAGGGETVLVVEDDDAVRRFAVISLTELGYPVFAASSGEQALEMLQVDDSIALLFSDIELGGALDGYELAKRGRNLKPDLKVVLCSGHASNQPPESEAAFLRKPYDPGTLGRAIRETLDT